MTVATRKEEGTRILPDVLGARVRARRGDLGLSQGDLARLMREDRGHKWSSATVSRLEAGDAEPTLSELVSLMLVLGSSFEELTDPVTAGDLPVDIGLDEPLPAQQVRQFLSGEQRRHYGGAGWVTTIRVRGAE